jgi:hypothetical protein
MVVFLTKSFGYKCFFAWGMATQQLLLISVTEVNAAARKAATAQFAEVGRWQVNAQRFDWRGRVVETRRAVAMNPPNYVDLQDDNWIALVSQTFGSFLELLN